MIQPRYLSSNPFHEWLILLSFKKAGNIINVLSVKHTQVCETRDRVTSLDRSQGAATLDFESCILSFFFVP